MKREIRFLFLGLVSLGGVGRADAPQLMADIPRTPHYSYTEVTGAAAMAAGGGVTMPGFEAGIGVHLFRDVPLYLGASVGSFLQPSPFALVFTLLPQAYYKFDAAPKVKPRIGIAMGPIVSSGGGRSEVDFAAVLSAGVDVILEQAISMNFLPKIGFFGRAFVFVPQLGVTVEL